MKFQLETLNFKLETAASCMLFFVLSGCTDSDWDPPERREDSWGRAAERALSRGNVRVTVDRFERDADDRKAFDLAFEYRDPEMTVSGGELGGQNGVLIFAARAGLQTALRMKTERRRTQRDTHQFLLLQEGTLGGFEVVRIAPTGWIVEVPVYHGAVLVRTLREKVIGTGMQVKLHRADKKGVELELLPYFYRADDGEALWVTELRTRLVLEPGRPYAVMSSRENAASFAAAFFSVQREDHATETIQILTAEVGE